LLIYATVNIKTVLL